MPELDGIGADWLIDEVEDMTHEVIHVTPSEYNEANRYLPESVSSIPGPLSYDVNPFMREIVDCFDIDSPVREVNLKKGVQITYSTVLESGALYFMGHVKTLPIMYMTVDKELATARIENNFIPMLNHSDLGHIIRSNDEGNSRKTGKTANHLQFEGGGVLTPFGAKNADKMRATSICIMLKDEIDAWPWTVGKDGCPDKLSDGRCKGYWERRKIFRGSTPTIKGLSKIEKAYLKGDQRKYMVLCLKCKFPQELRWYTVDKSTGVIGGFIWKVNDGELDLNSVRYCCQKCGHEHQEHDKQRLFTDGAEWVPTARPKEPGIRSYHLPALYSPIGMAPWSSLVSDYLDCYDPVTKKVIDVAAYQVFYNNVLAEPFEIRGEKVQFITVSAHRRAVYRLGEIPNNYAIEYSGGKVLFLVCTVDVHKTFLAVAVFGFTIDARVYLIEYLRFEDKDCTEIDSPVWQELREIIEEKRYTADDGHIYTVALTLVDAGYANSTVTTFTNEYETNVYSVLGRDRPGKNQKIVEFAEFKTRQGAKGYKITVDHYKDRMAPILRREWLEESGIQKQYHFNAPIDIPDKALKELTVETRRKQTDQNGHESFVWHRPSGARNELWDLLGYAYAGVEMLAVNICEESLGLDGVDWPLFWQLLESEQLFYQ